MSSLRMFLGKTYRNIKLNVYWVYVQYKTRIIRSKPHIKVLFVVSEISSWKTELLYKEMLSHPRFEPILGVSTCRIPANTKNSLIEYLHSKKYAFNDLDNISESIDVIKPDLIFYYKPYADCYSEGHYYKDNLKYVFCGMDYGFAITKHAVHMEKDLFDYCWQFYVENTDVLKRKREVCGFKARNVLVTGVPMQDVLLMNKENFEDPWKDKSGKKRIIYAPHHSIKGTNGEGIEFSTFLDYGEIMLDIAKKYVSQVTFAFKPHPNLYMKLVDLWGQKKTDEYYYEWMSLPNTQIETGEYVGLFKYSDAIIHDCATFIVEYLYVNNPSMYLVSGSNNCEDMLDYVEEGFYCYEQGYSAEDIEDFILKVINGIDFRKVVREAYIESRLMPPGGKTACENIINAILGQ